MGFRMPLSIDERKEIKRLLPTMSCTQIAARLNRSKNSVVTDVRINGGKENYDPNKAHERAVVVHRKGVESMIDKQKIAANDQVNTQRYVHVTALIQGLQREIDELKNHVQIILSKPKKVFQDEKRATGLERRIKILEEKTKGKKLDNPDSASYSIIPASEFNKYHKWPDTSHLMKLIREREANGFSVCCFKIGKRWMINESEFVKWATQFKADMLAQKTK